MAIMSLQFFSIVYNFFVVAFVVVVFVTFFISSRTSSTTSPPYKHGVSLIEMVMIERTSERTWHCAKFKHADS